MQVWELIEELKKFDGHKEVWVDSPDLSILMGAKEVKKDGQRNAIIHVFSEES